MGQRTLAIPGKAEIANLMELSASFLTASILESLDETLALVEKAGIERSRFLDLFLMTALAPWGFGTDDGTRDLMLGPALTAADLGLRNLRLTLAAAAELGLALPLGILVRDRLLARLAQDSGDLDGEASRSSLQEIGGWLCETMRATKKDFA